MECHDWSAWYDRMPGGTEEPELHVSGTCERESGSIELVLRPGNEGIVDDPELFVLELDEIRPDVGDTQMSPTTVEWHDRVGDGIKRVRIQGAASAMIDVRDVS
jgi:hypothetical protein